MGVVFRTIDRSVQKTINRDTYRTIRKHFSVVDQRGLPDTDDPNYDPLQNILQGLLYLKDKSRELWISGKDISIDERRVKSKSKRNEYRTFISKRL